MLQHSHSLACIYIAAWLRSFGIGLLGVVLGIFLYRQGYSSTAIGLVIATGIAGAACGTILTTFLADRLGRRATLFFLAQLTALGAVPLVFHLGLPALMALAFVGMLNGMGTDRSAAYALEQAVIPGLVSTDRRTWGLAWYSLVLDASGALGALAAGWPLMKQRLWGADLAASYRTLFIGYALLNVLSGFLYLLLSPEIEVVPAGAAPVWRITVSARTRSIVAKICALFALDSFGGGFLTDALVSYWFFRRFALNEERLAVLFFAVHVLNAVSHLGAAFLARRIGLVRTMVFTHLPSSLLLMAVPFAPSASWALALFLLRESLVEMDVPTRQSYVAALVAPEERTFASGATNLVRTGAWAAASSLSGVLMNLTFSAPLILGGGLKVIYDVLLYRSFIGLRPPEEQR
ncbi:MAG TPA: MFS transporter [Candidatus Saccharimonadales bacterium]|jgi:MFS family permease|nr:MFS transporter [Candidatus Saccharimonadales bacterium]